MGFLLGLPTGNQRCLAIAGRHRRHRQGEVDELIKPAEQRRSRDNQR